MSNFHHFYASNTAKFFNRNDQTEREGEERETCKRNPMGAIDSGRRRHFITRTDLMVTGRPCTRTAIMRGLRKCVKRDETTRGARRGPRDSTVKRWTPLPSAFLALLVSLRTWTPLLHRRRQLLPSLIWLWIFDRESVCDLKKMSNPSILFAYGIVVKKCDQQADDAWIYRSLKGRRKCIIYEWQNILQSSFRQRENIVQPYAVVKTIDRVLQFKLP